jgi:hypothetical protein
VLVQLVSVLMIAYPPPRSAHEEMLVSHKCPRFEQFLSPMTTVSKKVLVYPGRLRSRVGCSQHRAQCGPHIAS